MNPPEMILLIILVVVVGRVVRDRYRYQARAQESVTSEALMLRDEIRQMKERIAVLERVITDNHDSLDLDRQIERLRDR